MVSSSPYHYYFIISALILVHIYSLPYFVLFGSFSVLYLLFVHNYDEIVTIINYSLAHIPSNIFQHEKEISDKTFQRSGQDDWEKEFLNKLKQENIILKKQRVRHTNEQIEFLNSIQYVEDHANFSKRPKAIEYQPKAGLNSPLLRKKFAFKRNIKRHLSGSKRNLEYLIRATTKNIIDGVVVGRINSLYDGNGKAICVYTLACKRKLDTFFVQKTYEDLQMFDQTVRRTFFKEFEKFPKLSRSSRSIRSIDCVRLHTVESPEFIINDYFRCLLKYPAIRTSSEILSFLNK